MAKASALRMRATAPMVLVLGGWGGKGRGWGGKGRGVEVRWREKGVADAAKGDGAPRLFDLWGVGRKKGDGVERRGGINRGDGRVWDLGGPLKGLPCILYAAGVHIREATVRPLQLPPTLQLPPQPPLLLLLPCCCRCCSWWC